MDKPSEELLVIMYFIKDALMHGAFRISLAPYVEEV